MGIYGYPYLVLYSQLPESWGELYTDVMQSYSNNNNIQSNLQHFRGKTKCWYSKHVLVINLKYFQGKLSVKLYFDGKSVL